MGGNQLGQVTAWMQVTPWLHFNRKRVKSMFIAHLAVSFADLYEYEP